MTAITTPFARRFAPALLVLAAGLGLPAAGWSQEQPPGPPPTGAPPGGQAPGPEPRRIVYLPETVKAQLRDELKREVLEQARREGWAAPGAVPDWLRRFRPSGDVRGRFERSLFPAGNAAAGDFAAINANKPVDVRGSDIANDRFLDVDQNRSRPRLQTRLGLDVAVTDGLSAGLRLASGEGSSPVSTNQTLGAGGGSFGRYAFWLDRAFLHYAPVAGAPGVVLQLGRFQNPFFATDLVWSENVNLDGLALQLAGGDGFRPFLTAGAFPVYTTAFSFPADQPDKLPSRNRWLYAAQLGATWKAEPGLSVKLGAAFYLFDKLEGRVSESCDTHLKDVTCSTDDSRPGFAQKGNTYLMLRTPSEAALAQGAGGPEYQFFGLAARFSELALTGQFDLPVGPALAVRVDAEYVRNLGFERREIAQVAFNNRASCDGVDCPFAGGSRGYLGRITIGSPTRHQRGDWSAAATYRRLESDAVVDAFTDSDFGLGGTNLKGHVLAATLCVADGLTAQVRWLSADAVAGPPYRVDVLHLDLQARF